MVFAVQKWRHYLLNTYFIIPTDHKSLQYILSQRLTTAFQQIWLAKLMEFDLTIEFKQGEKIEANALSRLEAVDCQAITTVIPESNMLNTIIDSWQANPDIQKLI